MSSITLLSPAKVNLTLEVIGKRPDGYHDIRSLMQPVDLFDEVTVKTTDTEGIELSSSGVEIPEGEDNLAWKAADVYLRECGLDTGVSITIKKKIPPGSGLGGGSSNAAAVLIGLNRLTEALTEEKLFGLSPRLGADVAFFLRSVASVAEGIGERINVIKDFPLFFYVILCPNLHVSTVDVYTRWDELNAGNPRDRAMSDIEELVERFKEETDVFPLRNDLEESAFGLYPQIKSFKQILSSLDVKNVLMSGSGSAVYAVFRNELPAHEIYEYLKTSPTFQVYFASGIRGWHRII
ncbi:MAG TPA: 4-(cytidine 5'-diphospho)-2-C-methyl-D-erythritol kinase [Thermodesulfobacteriota bacterium]|nr:4-(cytidine 5'-diphospho)-2-C-methyl-D-erythritol kinase [Thermodesulfobacteriota bacterium]